MKKFRNIILSSGILLILLSGYTVKDTDKYGIVIDMSSFIDDTVLYAWQGKEFIARGADLIKVELDYSNLNASDATFSFGVTDFGDTYNEASASASTFPFTMNYDTDTISLNSARHAGNVKASKMFSIKDLPSENFAIWLDRGSVSSGYLKIRVGLFKTNE